MRNDNICYICVILQTAAPCIQPLGHTDLQTTDTKPAQNDDAWTATQNAGNLQEQVCVLEEQKVMTITSLMMCCTLPALSACMQTCLKSMMSVISVSDTCSNFYCTLSGPSQLVTVLATSI